MFLARYVYCRRSSTNSISRCHAASPIDTERLAHRFQAIDLFEVMEAREHRRATVIASQLEPNEWHLRIDGELMADSILSRITTGAAYIDIEGPNMRERFTKKKAAEGKKQ